MLRTDEMDIDRELEAFEAAERARLGIEERGEGGQFTDTMIDPMFTAAQRPETTILVGGLTLAHDYIVEGMLKGLGYQARSMECPDNDSLRFGKEFGNRGQCNPTYFNVGNLLKELARIRDEEGLTHAEIIERYVFMTAGACGPCRFGMYVTEYRKALRDAGFDGFRVMLFQQTGGLKQASGEELGLLLNPTFFLGVGKALFSGDILNLIAYRLRPYEVVEGATDKAMEAAKRELYQALENRRSFPLAMLRARKHFAAVEVDKTRAKPKVAVLGEFWAMMTEGDGNYHLQAFLESEGAEVDVQTIANLLLYNLWEFRHDTKARMELKGRDGGRYGLEDMHVGRMMAGLYLGEWALRGVWQTWAHLLGLYGHTLPDMDEVAAVGHSYYNKELRGGEGHLEVSKLVMNVVHQKAHMTLSVKPFGCMPSSGVSDGVQTLVTERFPEAIFCAVETNGDGAVNFYSRVQMFLFKAKQKAQKEFEAALTEHGVTREQVQAFLAADSRGHNFYKAPHHVAGTAADLVHEVAPLIGKSRVERTAIVGKRQLAAAQKWVKKTLPKRLAKGREVAPYVPALAQFVGSEIVDALPSPKAFYQKWLDRWIAPDAEEQAAIELAEEQLSVMVRPASKAAQSLPVMA